MTRTLRAVGRDPHVPTGSSQLDQGAKRTGPSTRTRPPHSLMPESRDDPSNDFPVTMPADQHMGTGSSIADQDHQLLGMPKG